MMKRSRPQLEERVKRFERAAEQAGVKLTHQRLEIFKEVARRDDHPDAEAVLRSVQRRIPTVARDTVYRTLWLLNDLGLVATVGVRRESVRFDANIKPHHHFVCTRCGLTRDFESEALDALKVPDAVSELGSVARTYVEVLGVCSRCEGNAVSSGRT